jgi:hypothetical protein
VVTDSINAGIGFVNAEINWALSFLPPFPPLPLAAAQTTVFKTAEVTAEPTTEATDDVAIHAATVEKHESSLADSVETAANTPAKPAAEPASATTDSSGGVAAQGEVRGGAESAAHAKRPEERKPDTSKKADKGVRMPGRPQPSLPNRAPVTTPRPVTPARPARPVRTPARPRAKRAGGRGATARTPAAPPPTRRRSAARTP